MSAIKWEKVKDNNSRHTAMTMYTTQGFRVWKGKYYVVSIIQSADEWHVERLSDHAIIYSDKTAKNCMETLEHALATNQDVQNHYCIW